MTRRKGVSKVGLTTVSVLLSALLVQQISGASVTSNSPKLVRLFLTTACEPQVARQLLLPSKDLSNMSNPAYRVVFARPVEEPIITEPVEIHILDSSAPAVYLTERLVNPKLPRFDYALGGSQIERSPGETVNFTETIAEFHEATKRDSYFSQMSSVNQNVVSAYTNKGLKISYYRSGSNRISIPGSIYVVNTLMPNAPRLVFFDLRLGSLVLNFSFYGGTDIDIASESPYVNLAVQQLLYACGASSSSA